MSSVQMLQKSDLALLAAGTKIYFHGAGVSKPVEHIVIDGKSGLVCRHLDVPAKDAQFWGLDMATVKVGEVGKSKTGRPYPVYAISGERTDGDDSRVLTLCWMGVVPQDDVPNFSLMSEAST